TSVTTPQVSGQSCGLAPRTDSETLMGTILSLTGDSAASYSGRTLTQTPHPAPQVHHESARPPQSTRISGRLRSRDGDVGRRCSPRRGRLAVRQLEHRRPKLQLPQFQAGTGAEKLPDARAEIRRVL